MMRNGPKRSERRIGIKEFGVVSIIVIVVLSYGLFFYLQNATENQIKASIFAQQKEIQLQSTNEISNHIGSDLTLVTSILDGLAGSAYLQDGRFHDNRTASLVAEKYSQLNGIVDRLFVMDEKDIVDIGMTSIKGSDNFVGNDFSLRSWVKETRNNLAPLFSDGFERLDTYTVFITYPIVNRETGRYTGMIVASIPTEKFFDYYGNIHDINSQFLVAYDRKATMLAVGASETLVGENFFGEVAQEFVNHNAILNNITKSMLAGNSVEAVYDYGKGERLTTGRPIYVQGSPVYFIQVVTPTATIYSQISDVLLAERIRMVSLLAGTSAATLVLIILLIKWNSSLGSEVKRRTMEVEESNRQLGVANEQLKQQDKMQREFINIAAHELRTPIQPIIGLTEMVHSRIRHFVSDMENLQDDNNRIGKDGLQEEERGRGGRNLMLSQSEAATAATADEITMMLDVIGRNAVRLEHLASDILDVSRIESQSLKLNKQVFDLGELVRNCIDDVQKQPEKNGKMQLVYNYNSIGKEKLLVHADRFRISQVISNLLSNAIKFTAKEGKISIGIEINDARNSVTVSVKDEGTGIDPEILPRLFTKFTSRSQGGTGLGLFISKSIVEAHGGRVWAENNSEDGKAGEGKGATFSLSLPLYSPRAGDYGDNDINNSMFSAEEK